MNLNKFKQKYINKYNIIFINQKIYITFKFKTIDIVKSRYYLENKKRISIRKHVYFKNKSNKIIYKKIIRIIENFAKKINRSTTFFDITIYNKKYNYIKQSQY